MNKKTISSINKDEAFFFQKTSIDSNVSKFIILASSLLALSLIVGCSDTSSFSSGFQSRGFLGGMWDGITAPFTILGYALGFCEVFASNSNGFPYTLGFILGLNAFVVAWFAPTE